MIRAHRFALALLFVAAAVIFLPALVRGEVFVIRDHLDYFQPLRWFTAEQLKAGHLPLWNPYSASGEPWLANPQTGVFYPPAWIFLVLPFPAAYMSFLLLHLVILGWGSYLLFARTASQGAAMVGAVALMFCGPTLSLLDVNNNLATLAWLPLVLWCGAERAWRRGAITLALAFLAGEPYFAGVGALMFAVVVLKGRGVKPLALAGFGAFGLSAVQLFPFLSALRDSDRAAGLSATEILRDSMPLRDWLRVAIPPSLADRAWEAGQQFIPIVYVGALVALLALVGLLSIRKPQVAGWVALLAFAVIIGSGPVLLAHLPLTLFRYPARMVPLGALALTGLAVAGWDRLRPANKRWLDLLVIMVVIVDLLPRMTPLLETVPFRRDVVPYDQRLAALLKFAVVGDLVPAERTFWISGYLNLYGRRFDAGTAAPFENESYRRYYVDALESGSPRKLSFLSVGYLLIPGDARVPPGLWALASVEHTVVYRNPTAWPMARLVSRGTISPAKWEMDATSARVGVDADERGIVVLAQQIAPGWSVRVDGEERPPIVVQGIFRGVEVEKGHHDIEWVYRPRSLFAGAIVTIITALVIVFSRVVKTAR
jgi:hypothetical protein